MSFAGWMKLEMTMLNEINQTQKDNYQQGLELALQLGELLSKTYYFMCKGVLRVCMSVHHLIAWCLWRLWRASDTLELEL